MQLIFNEVTKMIIANFTNNQDAHVTGLDQYDYGQVLRIQGLKLPTAVEIHFGLEETGGTTTTRIGVTKDGVTDVPIPDSMLENDDTSLDYTIYAFIYLADETSGKTTNRIKIKVKSRSKPELLNKPEDKELFQKAIEAVNRYAKEAEGWAHGREDMPERAADNAKYYSEQASVSAEEVKKVEQSVKDMVATVEGIEQQVQDVKGYAGQAKTAAENALLSERETKKSEEASLQHRTGAETAEDNAELAERNAKKSEQAVEQAKQLVMQMGQEVLQNKNHVDGKVEAFDKVVTDASDAIETVKTDAVSAVEAEGTKQVKAVEDKGNEVLQSIPPDFATQMESKFDKQQGVENKGRALVVGEDGNVMPGEAQGGEKWRVIKEFTIPQDVQLETTDVKYMATDDGKIFQFGITTDSDGKQISLSKVFICVKKQTPFYDFAALSNILFRYNTFTGNYNLLQFYRVCNQEARYLIGEIEKMGKYIKATASTFKTVIHYSWSSVTDKNVYVYNGIPESENITEICVSIPSNTDVKTDFRGATVIILGVDA